MLKGKSAIVTGSTSGIGLAIATALGREGANVAFNGFGDLTDMKKAQGEIEKAGGKTIYNDSDLTKAAEVARLVTEAKAAFGAVDILVNNAGIQHVAPVEEFPDDKWDLIIALNLSAAFHTSKGVFADMKARKWGRIINIASAHALTASPSAVVESLSTALNEVGWPASVRVALRTCLPYTIPPPPPPSADALEYVGEGRR